MPSLSSRYDFIYNSNKISDRIYLAYAQALKENLREFNVVKDRLTPTQLAQFSNNYELPIVALIDPMQAKAMRFDYYRNLSEEELLVLLAENQQLLKTPLLIMGKTHYFIRSIATLNNVAEQWEHVNMSSFFHP